MCVSTALCMHVCSAAGAVSWHVHARLLIIVAGRKGGSYYENKNSAKSSFKTEKI